MGREREAWTASGKGREGRMEHRVGREWQEGREGGQASREGGKDMGVGGSGGGTDSARVFLMQ